MKVLLFILIMGGNSKALEANITVSEHSSMASCQSARKEVVRQFDSLPNSYHFNIRTSCVVDEQ